MLRLIKPSLIYAGLTIYLLVVLKLFGVLLLGWLFIFSFVLIPIAHYLFWVIYEYRIMRLIDRGEYEE